MSLTMRPGPLSTSPTPEVNYRLDGPAHRILFEPHPRRIRAELEGRTVLDTIGGRLLHESNILPRLYVPLEDFDASLMERTDHTTHCPFKGDASYWSLRAGDRVAENAIWAYEDPLPDARWLAGYASMYWDAADAWYEEDEQVVGHLPDPYHRIDVRRSSRHAVARAGDEILAETDTPVLLFETNLPVRVYFRPEDVRAGLLAPTDRTTVCPYKGTATYWSVTVGGETIADAVWTYAEPLEEAQAIAGLQSFLADGIVVELEGAGIVADAAFAPSA
jgi:uncharacterized protein (DUF427 family)